ncbi:MAG TPA: DNA polymerase Y family protein, partial [Myxococcota bacterium]|nr:DNA polymerase Y family protein [Myxococcota bacterium]
AEVQGSLRCFGGASELLARMREGLAELGHEATPAVAATPRAALWRAQGGNQRLADLPVECTGNGEAAAFLKSIGISTVGELMRLPREGLAKRCGTGLVEALDRALGRLPEAREFFEPPARFDATLGLPGPVMHAEGVLFAARRLLVQLAGLLAARHAGVRRFLLTLQHEKGHATPVEILLASPARDVERFARLLHEKLAGVSLRHAVEAIRLQADAFAPLHARTAGFFGDPRADDEAWAQLVERLQARLGGDAIHGLTVQPDHRPEHAWRRVEAGEWDPREFVQPGPRPLWLLEQPRRMQPSTFERLAGPERIECGWWDGDDARRDYFIARSADASLLWIYREAGEWFLHGLFA